MKTLEYTEKSEACVAFQEEIPGSLTLMDLIAALCDETEDDTLVAAAVVDLFSRGCVRFQSGERVVFV